MALMAYTLSNDIDAWVQSVQPSEKDFNERRSLYNLLQQSCARNWDRGPHSLELFGSSRTGLLLPGSDIDVVIIDGYPNIAPDKAMEILTKKLQRSGMFKSVYFVRNAKVPIIKVQSKATLTADISCNVRDGIEGSNFIANNMALLPMFRPLFLIVKRLLSWYEMNDASNGGLGSYALSVMMLAYLKVRGREGKQDLGSQLLGFLDYYSKFNSKRNAVNFHKPGGIGDRNPQFHKHDVCVDNPNKINHNVASACRKWSKIQVLFSVAFTSLKNNHPRVQMNNRPNTTQKEKEKGRFSPFPFLSVLDDLKNPNSSSVPERIISKVVTKVSNLVKGNKDDKKVITIDDDDDDYDIVSHTETKKRKRDSDDEDEEEKEKEKKAVKQQTSSSPENTTTTTTTTTNNNNNKNNKNNDNTSTPPKQISPTKIPTFTPININNNNKDNTNSSDKEEEEEEDNESESDSEEEEESEESDNQSESDEETTTTTTTTTTTQSNKKNTRTSFIAPFSLPSHEVSSLIRPLRANAVNDIKFCSVCEKDITAGLESHLVSYSQKREMQAFFIELYFHIHKINI